MIRNARIRLWLSALVAVVSLSLALGGEWLRPPRAQAATIFVVNTVGDDSDATPGNGVCETSDGNGFCTLRAAIQEANLWPGDDRIVFSAAIPTPAVFALTRVGDDATALNGDLDIASTLSIEGRGMNNTIIDGDQINERVFEVLAGARATLSGLTIRRGATPYVGGGVLNQGVLTLTHSAVLSNSAMSSGGGIYSSGRLTVIGSTVRGNRSSAGYGGGFHIGDESWLENSTISENTARLDGGGVFASGTRLNIVASSISSNTALHGGGLSLLGDILTVTLTSIRANVALTDGAGIRLYSSFVLVQDSTIQGNVAGRQGGGIDAFDQTGQLGRLTIRNSTLSGNAAGTQGGGLHQDRGYQVALVNSTVSNNNANSFGGGIALISGTLGLTSTTVAGNLADANGNGTGPGGGGVRVLDGQARMWNTIVAYNLNLTNGIVDPDDCLGALFVANYLLLGDTSNCTIANGSNNLLDQDARLSPLADNGGPSTGSGQGPTQTRALKPDSPAIDSGASTDCPASDQRGFARPQDGDGNGLKTCDRGAYEYVRPGPFLPVVIREPRCRRPCQRLGLRRRSCRRNSRAIESNEAAQPMARVMATIAMTRLPDATFCR
jgi:CSLREA domain-containing protein